MDEIKGVIKRVTYFNEETGYFVVKIDTPRGDKSVVGSAVSICEGEYLYAQGAWESSNWGPTFKAKKVELSKPSMVSGIEAYLANAVEGIGPSSAKKLVAALGDKVFDIIENSPEKLKSVEGIGPKRAESIVAAYAAKQSIRAIMVYLHDLGLSTAKANKVYNLLGDDAMAKLKENPYLLCKIWGIGFKTADSAALKQGIPPSSFYRIKAGLTHLLKTAQGEGSCGLPVATLIENASLMLSLSYEVINQALDEELAQGNLLAEDLDGEKCVYSPEIHAAEKDIAKFLIDHAKRVPAQDILDIDRKIQEAQKYLPFPLDPVQVEAIRVALSSQVCVITGGPGAGKTTITRVILDILAKNLKHINKGVLTNKPAVISLAAPTGMAAKRATKATGFQGITVHRLLEVAGDGKFKKGPENLLEADVVSFDEFSMMDVPLTRSAFSAIGPQTRVIIIGDVDQLESVGPGDVLSDIIASGVVPTVRLKKVFRQGNDSNIITNAYAINSGEMPTASNTAGDDFFIMDYAWVHGADDANKQERMRIQKDIIRIMRAMEKKNIDPIRDVQVLAPMRKGILGTETLNLLLQETFNPRPEKETTINGVNWRTGDKVMQRVNNYDYEVFNGDVGYIKAINDNTFVIEYDGRDVTYKKSELDELTLAYAYTIHKSQGSEFPYLIMPFDMSHHLMLKRNLLYTGVTRAKKKCYILGPQHALKIAVSNIKKQKRYSCLKKWLNSKAIS